MAHSTGLLDLPSELLRAIADEIADYRREWHTRQHIPCLDTERQMKKQTIHNLRLVNKKLRNAASHALLPVLTISLNKQSLALAEEICTNKRIANGIKVVQLSASHYPKEIAQSLGSFKIFKSAGIDDMLRTCEENMEPQEREESTLILSQLKTHEESISKEDFNRAKQRWLNIICAWGFQRTQPTEPASEMDEEAVARVKEVLEVGFAQFKALHQKQLDLIQTGRFATTVARLIGALPSVPIVRLTDRTLREQNSHQDDMSRITDILLNNDRMLEFLIQPLDWTIATQYWMGEEIFHQQLQKPAASLLCDLPVALARNNVCLSDLRIECAPFIVSQELFLAAHCALKGTPKEMHQAMSSVRVFHFSPYQPAMQYSDMSRLEKEQSPLAKYLAPCLENTHLETVHLDLALYKFKDNRGFVQYPDLGKVWHGIGGTMLKRLSIHNASMSFPAFLNACVRTCDQLDWLELRDVFLANGSWASGLESLRSAIVSHNGGPKTEIHLDRIHDEIVLDYYWTEGWTSIETEQLYGLMLDDGDFATACDYVQGAVEVNPFLKYQISEGSDG